MSSRKSPTGPVASFTGIVALAQTVINAGSAGNLATATGFASVLSGPIGTAVGGFMNGNKMTTNDIVSASPRGTVPIGTSQIGLSFARVLSVSSATAIIEFSFLNPSTASATLVANTWNINVDLQSADF